MGELLQEKQLINVVPQNFQHSNKGKIKKINDKDFSLELFYSPEGILPNKMIEFYSPTKHGMLYFVSSVSNIEGNLVIVKNPLKHRFLQRRAFSRIKYVQEMEFRKADETYKVTSIDLSTGGMKLQTNEHFDIDSDYDLTLDLKGTTIKPKFEPIRVEKNDDNTYTLSGRFKITTNADKIALMQFCMKRNLENLNK